MKTTLENYLPDPSQLRWLRRWDSTGQVFVGAASIRTHQQFEAAKQRNIEAFRAWADAKYNELAGQKSGSLSDAVDDAKPKRTRRTKEQIEAEKIEEQPQDDADNEVADEL